MQFQIKWLTATFKNFEKLTPFLLSGFDQKTVPKCISYQLP